MIPFHEVLLRLFFAAGMGALIGVERDLRPFRRNRHSCGVTLAPLASPPTQEATTGTMLFALAVLGWATEKLSLKRRSMFFRFTTPLAQNVASEVHRLLANMKISMRQFSGTGNNSVVEFEADVSNHQEEQIIVQLSREGVATEAVPCEARP
jgi:uncharacterized membrane protein YhiD involved in acid resistance